MNAIYLLALLSCLACVSCVGAKIPKERKVTLEAKLKFKKNAIGKDNHYYTVKIGKRSAVWPTEAFPPTRLKRDKIYKLDLIEEEYRSNIGKIDGEQWVYWAPELVNVYDGSKLLYDATVCEVHRTQMDRKAVRITYGLYWPPKSYQEARDKDFPHTGLALGGCCVDSERTYTHSWVCSDCVANKERWSKENRKKRGGG